MKLCNVEFYFAKQENQNFGIARVDKLKIGNYINDTVEIYK